MRANVDDEFNTIWNSLVADINSPLKRLRNGSFLSTLSASTGASSPQSPKTNMAHNRNDNTVTLIKSNTITINSTSTTNTLCTYSCDMLTFSYLAAVEATLSPSLSDKTSGIRFIK